MAVSDAILANKQRTVLDTGEQLARLRQRIAQLESRPAAPVRPVLPPARLPEEILSGQVIENNEGRHFQSERFFAGHLPHGSADVGALCELPSDLLVSLGGEGFAPCHPERWAFLDTETTGLAGGSGTYAFLIGIGQITPRGFAVRQYFLRDFAEERSALAALREQLAEFDVLVTYNGRAYDQPLLETRYRMNRERPPFGRLPHLDLLHGSRRLWKLRLEQCKLTHLETQILGYERQGDVPGHLIPHLYFDFLRSHRAHQLLPVFHHNALDILTLACLTAIVPFAFGADSPEAWARCGLRHGTDLVGLARWLSAQGELERARACFRRALELGLPDQLLFRTLWDLAGLERKVNGPSAALPLLVDLSSCRNPHRIEALEELAKHYEHREKNYAQALDLVEEALRWEPCEALEHRRSRLESKLAKKQSRRLQL